MKFFIVLISNICITFIFSQSLTIPVEENRFQIDYDNNLILIHFKNLEPYADLTSYDSIKFELGENTHFLTNPPSRFQFNSSYITKKDNHFFTLYFTQIPIISITTDHTIIDEEKVLATFSYISDTTFVQSNIGIEIRGGSSKAYPKKTYDIEFWEDNNGIISKDVTFGNMRNDDDWILDALYNEPLRIRSFISHKLWLDIHTPHYLNKEKKAKSGVDVEYVEVFMNNRYNGIYFLSEQIDRKLLKLKDYEGEIKGELYKGINWGEATLFTSLPPFNNTYRQWGGYEIKYPKENHVTEWGNLYEFIDFVINSSNEKYKTELWEKFDYSNAQDYFIFLNLLRAIDNTGKNIYLAKYSQSHPYFYVPWDLDGCFGMIWDGSFVDKTTDILSNGLYSRIHSLNDNKYNYDIARRWSNLRKDLLDIDSLEKRFNTTFHYLKSNNVYEREEKVFEDYTLYSHLLNITINWIYNRLDFLDLYYDKILTTSTIFDKKNTLGVYPNPASTQVFVNIKNLNSTYYSISNLLGTILQEGALSQNNSINISSLLPGNYILKIEEKTVQLFVE